MAKSAGKGAAERLRAGYNFFSGALPLPFAGVGGFCIFLPLAVVLSHVIFCIFIWVVGGANNVLSPLLLAGAFNFVKLLFYTLLMLRLNSFAL